MNYNINYNNDEYYDPTGYNQPWQNGENNYDKYGYSNNKKALPQPPMSYSQSVNDGFNHRLMRRKAQAIQVHLTMSCLVSEVLVSPQHQSPSSATIVNCPNTPPQLINPNPVVFQNLPANCHHPLRQLLPRLLHFSGWAGTTSDLLHRSMSLYRNRNLCSPFCPRVNLKCHNLNSTWINRCTTRTTTTHTRAWIAPMN